MTKQKINQKINGEMAVRRLSEKAQAVYNTTDPLVVREYEQWDDTFYSIEGAFGDYYDLTFDELEENLESFADENELWYAILTDEDDDDWGTGSFDLEEAMLMAVKHNCEKIAVIKGDYVNGEPTTDPICVEELIRGEDFCNDTASYYYYETNAFNGVLATDGFLVSLNSVNSKGIDETTGVDIYADDAVEQLKKAYVDLEQKGTLYNFRDIARDLPHTIEIFNRDDYERLELLVEVA